ncbi:MAG: hypothetical protein WC679_01535 [Bacteroidales bacterium]|jgi:hypothetical protein
MTNVEVLRQNDNLSEQQINQALVWLEHIGYHFETEPYMMFMGNEVGCYWRKDNHYLSVSFDSAKTSTWIYTNGITFISGYWRLHETYFPLELQLAMVFIT